MSRKDVEAQEQNWLKAFNGGDASGVAARRKTALREIARAYLAGAGMSVLGETARASGLSRVEAGLGNHQLVDEGYAIRLRQGIYALASGKNG